MSSSSAPTAVSPPEESSLQLDGGAATKNRRLRGTPGTHPRIQNYMPRSCGDAEVVALSPPALLGWNRCYVCEACGWGFQRRRHHKHLRRYVVPPPPGKLRRRRDAGDAPPARKRVFVCPEPGCQYHAPARALSDLPTLQNHFRRNHGRHGLWACGRGSSGPAVCADCKAHLTTSGGPPGQLHEVATGPSSGGLAASSAMVSPASIAAAAPKVDAHSPPAPPVRPGGDHNLDLQLMPPGESGAAATCIATPHAPAAAVIPRLDLALGLGGAHDEAAAAARLMLEEAREHLVVASAEKAAAEEARAEAARRAELAGLELASAQRMRQRAREELARAHAAATRQLVNARMIQLTCCTCTAAAAASSTPPELPR
ncbi:unnamed protein product [Urochloa decumbens]|uniref:BIRD-IDD transcription factor second C2H2 zinc finger domain-containing protein n=1 Tax=Urochloa decumbens TaxID=240449 RepID=A0ABC9A6E4_9POAL